MRREVLRWLAQLEALVSSAPLFAHGPQLPAVLQLSLQPRDVVGLAVKSWAGFGKGTKAFRPAR